MEQRADEAPASNDSADANDGRDDSFTVPLEDVAGGGNRLGVAARPSSDSADGEGRCAEKDEKEKKDGKTRPAVRGGQAPRLFESLLSVRVCSRTHYVLDQMLVVSSVADEALTASNFRVLLPAQQARRRQTCAVPEKYFLDAPLATLCWTCCLGLESAGNTYLSLAYPLAVRSSVTARPSDWGSSSLGRKICSAAGQLGGHCRGWKNHSGSITSNEPQNLGQAR